VSCTAGSLPAGQVATNTDCAPNDPAAWRTIAFAGGDQTATDHDPQVQVAPGEEPIELW
jgi:hypothetical protein